MSLDQKLGKAGDSRTAFLTVAGGTIGYLLTGGPVGTAIGALGGYIADRASAKSYAK